MLMAAAFHLAELNERAYGAALAMRENKLTEPRVAA